MMEMKALHSRPPMQVHGQRHSSPFASTLGPCSSSILALKRARGSSSSVCMVAFYGMPGPDVAGLHGMVVLQSVGQQERTVPIPRWVAEKMLVERYKDMLSTMSDAEVAKLFEQEGVGLKEFPQGLVGRDNASSMEETSRDGRDVVDTRDDGAIASSSGATTASPSLSPPSPLPPSLSPPSPAVVGRGEEEDETAALLEEGQNGLGEAGDRARISSLLQYVDSKDIALIAMGTGGLVLGTALMYILISTLSSSSAKGPPSSPDSSPKSIEQKEDAREGQQRNGEETASSVPDPYTMYAAAQSTDTEGGVIWERRENSPAPQDLWRVPMEDLRSPQLENGSSTEEVAPEQRDARQAKRPPAFEDILDNAESISITHSKSRSKNVS